MQTTSDRIAQRMKELGLQHKDLVAATGASKGTVTNWISGVNNPTGKRLVQLAQALKTTSSWLYRDWETDRKSTRLNSSHSAKSRMPSSA